MADIKVRVGAQNAIKVLSSASGGNALFADTATNVIGGIASVTQLDVSGISTLQSLRVSDTLRVTGLSTFVGVATFLSNQYVAGNVTIGGTLQVGDTIFGTDIDTRNLKSSGITTLASNGGITTTGGDLYVGGDLYIADDVVLDEVVLRNINVTGISTLGIASAATLNVVGISTFGTINATGVSTFSSPVSFGSSAIFGDNDKILLGDGADLQIFHDSVNSFITDAGTGDLKLIGAGNIVLENSTLGTNSAVFDTTGGIDLYWGGAGTGKRLEIAGYGATITGDLYLSGDLFTGGEGKIGEDVTTRNLDVTGISTLRGTLSVAGVTTFTSLVDADSGIDVTGHSELDTVYVSGLSTFVGDAKFDGNVSIAGTLTKEDVTNIDSVGIVTAGKGLRVTTGGIVVTAGITTFNDDVQFPGAAYNILWDQATSKFKFDDSAQLVFGSASGGDMKLFHQSGNSTIRNETGQFRIAGNDIRLQTQNHSEDYLLAVDGGSVSIFYNDIKRLETSSSGVDITDTLNVAGILTAATANVTGTLTAGLIDGGSY